MRIDKFTSQIIARLKEFNQSGGYKEFTDFLIILHTAARQNRLLACLELGDLGH